MGSTNDEGSTKHQRKMSPGSRLYQSSSWAAFLRRQAAFFSFSSLREFRDEITTVELRRDRRNVTIALMIILSK